MTVAAGLSRPYSFRSVASRRRDRLHLRRCSARPTSPSTAPKSARASDRLRRSASRRSASRTCAVALAASSTSSASTFSRSIFRTVLSRRSNVDLLKVDSRIRRDQEDARLVGELGVEVGAGRRLLRRSAGVCSLPPTLKVDLDARRGRGRTPSGRSAFSSTTRWISSDARFDVMPGDLRRRPAATAAGCDDLPRGALLLERRLLARLRLDRASRRSCPPRRVKTLSCFGCRRPGAFFDSRSTRTSRAESR